jgi:enoyl-CoA hydratase/carnithine racemase
VSYATLKQQDTIAVITLNRPERLNAISDALMVDLLSAIDRTERADEVRAVVLCGAGRAFCAGEDLKELEHVTQNEGIIHNHVAALQNVTRTMRCSTKVYITAAHGYAVGGGFEWMVSGDLVVAADDLVAFLPEIDRALFPTGGVSWLLPTTLGYHRAMELMLLGERQSAERLLQLGLVNWVVPKEHLLEKAVEIATRIAAKSALSIMRLKKLLNQDLAPVSRALELELQYAIETFKHPEAVRKAAEFVSDK